MLLGGLMSQANAFSLLGPYAIAGGEVWQVDFGITQVVDGNWGVHAIIKKNLFAGA